MSYGYTELRLAVVLIMGATLFIGACRNQPRDLQQTLYVFGTLLEIRAYTADATVFARAVKALDGEFQRMHKDWHAWRPGGQLAALNQAIAEGRSAEIDPALLDLLRQGRAFYRQSEGLFNPAIGRLIGLWGFHSDVPPGGPPPAPEAIAALLQAQPGMDDLVFQDSSVGSRNPVAQLDLGAYAKGYALDLAVASLRQAGIGDVIVNAGGDLCVSGQHGERPWRIGIRHPQGKGVIASLEVSDGECVLTSGNYERYREYEGIRYAHIIDPRSGYPVRHVASVTVVARDGALADAAATALSVAGPDSWRHIARSMGVDSVMLVDEQGRVHLTESMRSRVRFEPPKPEEVPPPAPEATDGSAVTDH
jgi:thiamine biosynthesis lipoprotein